MARKRLTPYVDFSFELVGIICNAKDHKLAWYLNNTGFFNFRRVADLRLEFNDNTKMLVSNFEDKTDQYQHTLLRNRLNVSNSMRNQFLIPELKEFDFFIKIETSIDDFDFDGLISSLKEIPLITYLVKLNVEKIKQKENLLF